MKQSRLFLPTQRGNSVDADLVSHQLMLRAGLVRQLTSGVYALLPFGTRVLQKIEALIRREMDGAGAQEVLLPVLQPEELWLQSGRRDVYGASMFSLIDRQQQSLVLSPTHEEVITNLVRNEVHYSGQFPLTLYQMQSKFLDEQPIGSFLCGREFRMTDAYSFDLDEAGLNQSYQAMYETYSHVFERLGIEYKTAETVAGVMEGESGVQIFVILSDAGGDTIAECPQCGYAAFYGSEKMNQTRCREVDGVLGRGFAVNSIDDSRVTPESDQCPNCQSALQVARGIAVGHFWKLGARYSSLFNASYLDEDGESVDLRMGCYALGTTRLLLAIVEQCHDDDGLIWPLQAAPYKVHLVPVSMRDEEQVKVSQVLYQRFQAAEVEILFDDRDERVGVKLKDADLLGLPVRLTIGSRIRDGEVEVYLRGSRETQILPVEQAFQRILNLVK